MSEEIISQLIGGGVGVILALVAFGIIWRLPEIFKGGQAIVDQIIKTAEAGADRLEEANERISVSNSTLITSIQLSQETTRDALERLRVLDTRVAILEETVKELERQIEEKDKKITQQFVELTAKNNELFEARGLVESLEKEKATLVSRVEQLELEKQALEDRVARLEQEKEELKSRVAHLEFEIDDIRGKPSSSAGIT